MADQFDFADAFKLDDGTTRLNVTVCFDAGAPSTVFFSDPDREGSVGVPYDLFARVVAGVEKCVDINRTDGGAS